MRYLYMLMFIFGLSQFGMSFADLQRCHTRACWKELDRHSRDVLRINWKPISMFPEEAKRFQ